MTSNDRRTSAKDKFIYPGLIIIGGLYIAALLTITLFSREAGRGERVFQCIPFSFAISYARGEATVAEVLKNVLGNFALYIPLGVLLPCLFPKLSVRKAVLAGFLTSLCCELIQYAAAVGTADIDDLMLNTLGALAGAALYCKLLRRARTIRIARLLSLILLAVYGVCGVFAALNNLPEILPRQTEYVHSELLGNDTAESCDVSGSCREIRNDGVVLGGGAPAEFRFSEDAVILLCREAYRNLPNGYIYKTIFTYEACTIQEAQALIAERDGTECDLWIDPDGACRMLILTV